MAGRTPKGAEKKRDSHIWARHPDDWYVEEAWCNERLFAVEQFDGGILDPACGMGRIVKAARAAGLDAVGTDLRRRADGMHVLDFLDPEYAVGLAAAAWMARPKNIVSNPPFKHALRFVMAALAMADDKVAMLLPSAWGAGDKRSRWLEQTPLIRIHQLTPRPSMPPGPVIEAGIEPGGGRKDFSWFIWRRGYRGHPTQHWLRRDP